MKPCFSLVAQIFNLLNRRISFCPPLEDPEHPPPIWKPAPRRGEHAPFSASATSCGFRSSVFGFFLGLSSLLFFAQPTPALDLLVYNNDDSGPGSLRQTIEDNNASGGNTIVF